MNSVTPHDSSHRKVENHGQRPPETEGPESQVRIMRFARIAPPAPVFFVFGRQKASYVSVFIHLPKAVWWQKVSDPHSSHSRRQEEAALAAKREAARRRWLRNVWRSMAGPNPFEGFELLKRIAFTSLAATKIGLEG